MDYNEEKWLQNFCLASLAFYFILKSDFKLAVEKKFHQKRKTIAPSHVLHGPSLI